MILRRATQLAVLYCVCGAMLVAAPALAASGNVIPHGGYDTTTDACLQCHDIHESAGDYVLMREETITDVCATCHTLYQSDPTGAFDPGYPGDEAEEVPDLAAYKVGIGQKTSHNGHRLGLGDGNWVFSDGTVSDGSYIPGGTQTLTAIQYLAYPNTTSALNFTAANGLNCASCHTPHGAFGNMMPANFSTKLLSSRPNHGAQVTGVTDWVDDGGKWCGACHDRRTPGSAGEHGSYAWATCMSADCHSLALEDFPHSAVTTAAP